MKKLFISLFLLMAGVMAVQAQSLTVGGKTINLTSTATYSGGDITSGTVKFDASTKTLTLTDVTITSSTNNGIYAYNLGTAYSNKITIDVVGTLSISSSFHGIRVEGSYVTITGNHNNININHTGSNDGFCGINLISGSSLEIWNAILDVKGGAGAAFFGGGDDKVEFIRVYADISSNKEAIHGFKYFTPYDDCLLFTENASFQSGVGVVDASGTVLKQVKYRPFLMVGKMIILPLPTSVLTDSSSKRMQRVNSTRHQPMVSNFTSLLRLKAVESLKLRQVLVLLQQFILKIQKQQLPSTVVTLRLQANTVSTVPMTAWRR